MMNTRQWLFAAMLVVSVSGPAIAEPPENYLDRWEDPAVQRRIDEGIERHRRSDMTWNLGDGTPYGNEGVAGGGLCDEEFNPKPAYTALDQLINHQWKTNVQATANADGQVSFRGFHGQYAVEVTRGSGTTTHKLTLSPAGPVSKTLAMP